MSPVLLAPLVTLPTFSAIVCLFGISKNSPFLMLLKSNHFIVWTKVLASQKYMVCLGLFHPCEHKTNISGRPIDLDKEHALLLLWQTHGGRTNYFYLHGQTPTFSPISLRSTPTRPACALQKFFINAKERPQDITLKSEEHTMPRKLNLFVLDRI